MTDRSSISECPIPIEVPAGGIHESKFVCRAAHFNVNNSQNRPYKITIAELSRKAPYDRVSLCNVRVGHVGDVEVVNELAADLESSPRLQAVEVVCCESTQSCKLRLWGKYIGALKEGTQYSSMHNLMVKVFQNEIQLTTPKNGTVEFVASSGEVVAAEGTAMATIDQAKIVSVLKVESGRSCKSCTSGESC